MAGIEREAPEAFEWAARELFEAQNGQGAWREAKPAQRSGARLLVRLVLASLERRGYALAPSRSDRRASK